MQSQTLTKLFDILEIPHENRSGFVETLETFVATACFDSLLTAITPEQEKALKDILTSESAPATQKDLYDWIDNNIPDEQKESVRKSMIISAHTAMMMYFDELARFAGEQQKSKLAEVFSTQTL